MGRVVVKARIENLDDLYEVRKGQRTSEEVRAIDVDDALGDTGAYMLFIPRRLVKKLGLKKYLARRPGRPRLAFMKQFV